MTGPTLPHTSLPHTLTAQPEPQPPSSATAAVPLSPFTGEALSGTQPHPVHPGRQQGEEALHSLGKGLLQGMRPSTVWARAYCHKPLVIIIMAELALSVHHFISSNLKKGIL